MKLKWILLTAGGILCLFILAGCNMPSTCATNNLQAVNLASPAMWEIVDSLSPLLSWTYPDTTCTPEGYRIDLKTGPFFDDDLGGGTGDASTSWAPGSPLEPGREYAWAVSPINGTSLGPIAGNRYFFTGPMCATADLQAPALFEPADGAEVHELSPSLIWQYLEGCLPQGYRVDLSTDPTFADTHLSGGTGNPSTRWGPGEPLADCTTYFWRVAPINDTTLGPFSDVNYFRTNAGGGCAPEPTGSISGVLWYDRCPLALDTSPVPDPLPAGCAETIYGVDADGIHQPGEPWMTSISIAITPGVCPAGGPKTTLTDGSGAYVFNLVPPGKYCLNVNAASFVGPGGTGHWTVIPSGHEGNTYRSVLLGAGMNLTGQDFAWYEQAGGPTPTPVPTYTPSPTPTPVGLYFTPGMNLNCRTGPDPLFPMREFAMQGIPYLLDGQNPEHSWYRIFIEPEKACWVLASAGKVNGDVGKLRVIIPPPLPTFTFTPTFVKSCSIYTDEKSCELHPGCYWHNIVSAAPFCSDQP